VGYPNTG
jgi:adenylate/nucleoside-diphosphate kinase